MEDELTEFINRVGARLKKKPDAMKPFLQTLQDNWYDSVDSLKDINDDTWSTVLKFPSRLVSEIKAELSALDSPAKAEEG